MRFADTNSAALVTLIAGVGFILWYRSRSEAQRAALTHAGPHVPIVSIADGKPEEASVAPVSGPGLSLRPVPHGTPVPTLNLP